MREDFEILVCEVCVSHVQIPNFGDLMLKRIIWTYINAQRNMEPIKLCLIGSIRSLRRSWWDFETEYATFFLAKIKQNDVYAESTFSYAGVPVTSEPRRALIGFDLEDCEYTSTLDASRSAHYFCFSFSQ